MTSSENGGHRVAYINARLICPQSGTDGPGAVLTEDDRIADAGPQLFSDGVPTDIAIFDCGGQIICPGVVDLLTKVGEPGGEQNETLATASASAAAGGVTTLICKPNTLPVIDDPALVDYIERRARDTAIVRVHPIAAVTRSLEGREITEMGLLAEAGAVAFSDGDHALADALTMRRALSYSAFFNAAIIQHPEDPSLAADGCMNEGETAARLGLTGIPAEAEVIMVERDIHLVSLTGGTCHFSQVTTKRALDAIRAAKQRRLNITCGVSPLHFTLTEEAVGEYRTFAKTSPPLRSEADRLAVIDAIADGTIDVITSNHDPQDVEGKRLPFARATYGVSGLETLLPLSLALHHTHNIPLARLMACLSHNPAQIVNLPGGSLTKGAPADLVIFDPDADWLIDPDKFRGKCHNSPFDNYPVRGQVSRTIVGGVPIFVADPQSGKEQ